MKRVDHPLVSKWIPDLKSDTPLLDGARRVLGLRMRAVSETYRLALRKTDETIEHVHQLRVATRRCGAALEAFENCLPNRLHDQAKKMLRRLRRRAGEARDWDVFLEKLAAKSPVKSVLILEGYALARRLPAQTRLARACPEFPFDFERMMTQTLGGLACSADDPKTMSAQAFPTLEALLGELAAEMNKRDTQYSQLHQVRLVGKKLRYAMEIFADCFDAAFREDLYPLIEEMQEILGEINDHHNASVFYTTLAEEMPRVCPAPWKQIGRQVTSMVKSHQESMARGRKQFAQWKRRWKSPQTRDLVSSLIGAKNGLVA